jgi:hypothetical protein
MAYPGGPATAAAALRGLTRAALREAEATGNIAPIRDAITSANLPAPARRPPVYRRLVAATVEAGGVVVAGLGALALAVMLALIGGEAIGGKANPVPSTTGVSRTGPPTTTVAAPKPGQIGATAWSIGRAFVNGDYSMSVEQVEQGLTQIGESGTWTSEQGQFVVVSVVVEYKGTGSGVFHLAEQRLLVSTGVEYNTDVKSVFRAQTDPVGQRPLKPYQPEDGILVFDVPVDGSPTAIEFVGDFLAEPVTIPLG